MWIYIIFLPIFTRNTSKNMAQSGHYHKGAKEIDKQETFDVEACDSNREKTEGTKKKIGGIFNFSMFKICVRFVFECLLIFE